MNDKYRMLFYCLYLGAVLRQHLKLVEGQVEAFEEVVFEESRLEGEPQPWSLSPEVAEAESED